MPYIVVENFGGGMDVRRSSAAAPGGTMRLIENASVNKGGEIEKRKAFRRAVDVTGTFFADLISSGTAVGPYPSFNRNGVNIRFTGGSTPASAGDWLTPSGELVSQTYGIGVIPTALIPATFALPMVLSIAFFTDEMILAYGGSTLSQFDVRNDLFGYTAGRQIETSITAIAGRTGMISPEAGAGAFALSVLSRFDSAFYSAPNIFSFGKSQTAAPELDTGTGFGRVDVRSRGDNVGRPIALQGYFGQLAVFCENGIQFWDIDADPANLAYDRAIVGEALLHPRAHLPFGSGDILYLTRNGIRSLRARDSSNFAETTDIGSPIDEAVQLSVGDYNNFNISAATAVVLRETGQAMFFIGQKAYVLSRYPSARVTAWSTFTLPAIVMDVCPQGNGIIFRDLNNRIYQFGGERVDAPVYDSTQATVLTHYFGVEQPYTEKVWRSIDLACEGTWFIEYSIDPRNEFWVSLGSVTGNTHLEGGPQIDVSSPLIAFRFRTFSASAAKLSQFAIHYDVTEIKA